MRRRDFWPHASEDARLRQMTGAIDAGLTSTEAAILLGATSDGIKSWAKRRGLSFTRADMCLAQRKAAAAARARAAQQAALPAPRTFDQHEAERLRRPRRAGDLVDLMGGW